MGVKGKKVGFVGGGNMGEALIRGLAESNLVPSDAIVVTDVRADRTRQLADQYGVRTLLKVDGADIKFEIVLEGRIELEAPTADDHQCGVATLTPLDMATSKLLANSDRWMDDGVFSRDLIDLAMMKPPLPLLRQAMAKAEGAYGMAVGRDLARAIERMQARPGWLQRCLQAMAMTLPPAQVWQRIRALRRALPVAAPPAA